MVTGLLVWVTAGLLVGLVVGRVIRYRDRQVPDPSGPFPDGPPVPGARRGDHDGSEGASRGDVDGAGRGRA